MTDVPVLIFISIFSTTIIDVPVYLDPNEMSGQSFLCTCPQTILLSEKENKICRLLTHW